MVPFVAVHGFWESKVYNLYKNDDDDCQIEVSENQLDEIRFD